MHLLFERVVKAVKKSLKFVVIFALAFAGVYIFAGCLPPMRPIYFKENPEGLFWIKAALACAAAVFTAVLCGEVLSRREGAQP